MQRRSTKRGLSLVLAILMVAMLIPWALPAASADPVFATTPSGVLQGMPLFNANPDDLEAYLDVMWEYYGVEGFAVSATEARNNSVGYYTLVKGANAGKRIVSGHRAVDTNNGVSIAIPSSAGFAHTWNEALAVEVGTVYGDERLATQNHAYSNLPGLQANCYPIHSDIRVNQQCGRYYNGFGGEDPMHTVVLGAGWSGGVNGTLLPESDNGFWLKHSAGTKHFPNHSSEYNRTSINSSTSARGLMEYHFMTGIGLAKTNTVNGWMSSFGATNGIPNVMSPIKKYVTSFNKWAQYSSPDMNGYSHLTGNMHNGYQSYAGALLDGAPNGSAQTALVALTANQGGATGGQLEMNAPGNLWEACYNPNYGGLWGVTPADVRVNGRDMLVNMIRLGVFNERENYTTGRQLNWPFVGLSNGGTANTNLNGELMTYTARTDHQAVVLRAAQESPVLLRNDDNCLPIPKTAKVYTLGTKTSHMNNPQYAIGSHAALTNAALAPWVGVQRVGGTANVTNYSDVATNGHVVAIKCANGQYWYAPDGAGGQITTADKPADGVFTDNYLFALITMGQGQIWIQSLARNGSVAATNANDGAVQNTGNAVSLTANLAIAGLRIEEGANGKYHLMTGNMTNNGWTSYYNGRLLRQNGSNINAYGATLGNIATAATQRADATTQFEFEVVREAGSTLPTDADYAVVFIGNNTVGLSEGNDRGGMDLGLAQYALASGVAKNYPGKTVVVVTSNEPLLINELKQDPNIGAIILTYYSGEYTFYALGQCIYGDVDFTGRTASSWYKTIDVFPEVDKYIAAQNTTFNVANIDPRFKNANLAQTDPESTRTTYWYADPDDVAYPFGAGLSYATFQYSNMVVGAPEADGSFKVMVTVRNTSTRSSQEVLQLYASNPDSAYGDAAPLQKLVAFEKVSLFAGQTRTVTLTVDPIYISIWDVTANDYLFEDGDYNIYFGTDCYTPIADCLKTLTVDKGNVLATLRPMTPVNVFDASFTARDVVYREYSKGHSIKGYKNGDPAEGYYAVMSLGSTSYTAMKNVQLSSSLDRVGSITANVAKAPAGTSTIDIRLDAPDGPLYATIPVDQTAVVEYNEIPNFVGSGFDMVAYPVLNLHTTVREIGYVDSTAAVNMNVEGVHDLYFVFHDEDVRLNTIQLNYAVDKSALADAIAQFEALNPYDWMGTDAWDDAVDAYEAALAVYDDPAATQAEVDKATADLLAAIAGLVDKPYARAAHNQPTTVPLRVKQVYQLNIETNVNDLVFFSSNSANVTVSETGVITGVRAGLAVITARSLSNPTVIVNIVVTCTI